MITPRRPKGWTSWQRSEDYYNEGLLIWLEIDSMLRAQTKGARDMDDFARDFFGGRDGDWSAKPYTLVDVVRVLNSIAPFDWAAFLKSRLTETSTSAPLAGFASSGYTLTYTDEPTAYFKDAEKKAKQLNLTYSAGMVIGKGAKITSVMWDSPAFTTGLSVGMEIVAVNGTVYGDDVMKDAIKAAKGGKEPIRLIIRSANRVKDVPLLWTDGLRYPRLEKKTPGDSALDRLLAPRP